VTDRPGAGERRTIAVDALARVEGEGALFVDIRDGAVRDVQLRIYEPPRFFEAFLRGRHYTEPPDITARICGICPVAYQMSACAAIEDACGVTVDGPLADLRHLVYCGEWIESHALHVHLLHAPDFLGYESAIDMAHDHRAAVERGLQLKKVGNALVEALGGRAVHPVNVRLGGFYRVPTRRELAPLRERLLVARDAAVEVVAWVSGFPFPDDDRASGDASDLAALVRPGEYAITGGRWCSTGGLDLAPGEFEAAVVETHEARSTALHASLAPGGAYTVGPLARYALNAGSLAPAAAAAARDAGLRPGTRDPFRSIVARAIEVVHACDVAVALVDGYEEPDTPAVAVDARPGSGCGWTEAPRGTLWHRYDLAADGTISAARIVPPTSQNQRAIERELWRVVEDSLHLPDDELGWRAEQLARSYDPCISCATHFLDVRVRRS
jgi:sulfhydrogenase subunit alpha